MLLPLPPLMLEIWLGHRRVLAAEPALFRRLVLLLLSALALADAGRTLYELRGTA